MTRRLLVLDRDTALCRPVGRIGPELGFVTHTLDERSDAADALTRCRPHVMVANISTPGNDLDDIVTWVLLARPAMKVILLASRGTPARQLCGIAAILHDAPQVHLLNELIRDADLAHLIAGPPRISAHHPIAGAKHAQSALV